MHERTAREGRPDEPPSGALIGREDEKRALSDLLRAPGVLVTLTGPGGVGKSTLAAHVAATLATGLQHGTLDVRLARLEPHDRVESEIARTLGLSDTTSADVLSRLVARLRDTEMLLILDNAEHLPGTAAVVTALLEGSERLRVLVTSRTPLHVSREREFPLGPLPLPDPRAALAEVRDTPSVRLFVRRAVEALPHFELTPQSALAVTEVCTRLDGLPLAIELAAARVRVLPPAALLRHLDSALDLLTDAPHDRPEHQRSLRATLAWSAQLLSPEERELLWTLGVFAGGATLEALSAVSGMTPPAVVRYLDTLARHHLVRVDTTSESEARFDLLYVIREFALEHLDHEPRAQTVREGHARFFLTVAEHAAAALWSECQPRVLADLEREHGNLRAALAWSARYDRALALELAAALGDFWSVHGHFSEGRAWLERALHGEHQGRAQARTKALLAAGEIARMQGDHGVARRLLHESLAFAGEMHDASATAAALNLLGVLAHNAARPDEARAWLQEAVRWWNAEQRDLGRTTPPFNLGRLALYWGEVRDSLDPLGQALTFWQARGNSHGVAYALYALGRAHLALGDATLARRLLNESLTLREGIGDERGVIASHTALGLSAVLSGDAQGALPHLHDALRRATRLGHRRNVAESLEDCAAFAVHTGDAVRAVRLCEAARTLRESIGAPAAPLDERQVQQTLARAHGVLSNAVFALEARAGALMGVESAVAEAFALSVPTGRTVPFRLSPREQEVLQALVAGYSNREIARTFSLSEKTVARHVENLYGKLGVRTRAAAVALAFREGLVQT